MVLDVPVATDHGAPITGRVRSEIIIDGPAVMCMPLSGRISGYSYPIADQPDAVLTRRRYPYDPPEVIPATEWQFAMLVTGAAAESAGSEQAVVQSDRHIYYPAGFQPGWIYEL